MSEPDPASPAPTSNRTRRRWLGILLVASVAFNLVIVGAAVSGQFWSEDRERRGYSADLLPRSFFKELDEERRNELAAVFRARKPEFREERGAMRDAATALADALEREPFDPQLAKSAITDHAGRSHQLIDLVATVAEDLVEDLMPEERRALAQAIRHRLEVDRERRKRRSR
jgi:hypothetical protein